MRNTSPVAVMGWKAMEPAPTEMERRATIAAWNEMSRIMAEKFPIDAEYAGIDAWENQSEELKRQWIASTRAAIRAMLDPTEPMRVAYYSVVPENVRGCIATAKWNAMIMAASPPDFTPPRGDGIHGTDT